MTHPSAEQRFPELSQFELEMEVSDGEWWITRADEDERSATILNDASAVLSMLAGGYRSVLKDGVRTRFRLTPKAWLEKKRG